MGVIVSLYRKYATLRDMNTVSTLITLAKRVRHGIITSTTSAGSGHPSSSLSAVELITALFFGGYFKQDTSKFTSITNDKFVLSKGHAAPLLYSLYETADVITKDELLTLRKFDSRLQGHPTPEVPFVDVTTGSLGQGLSVGVGMAIGLQRKSKTSNVYVLLGDSEFAEGQNYEALQLAGHYKLNNLIGILDVNRLGQRGETQIAWDTETYKKRVESFGWDTEVIENGNDMESVLSAFEKKLGSPRTKPLMFIAKTKKGAGVSFMEDADNWHGKPIPQDKLQQALQDIGDVDFSVTGTIDKPKESASERIATKKPVQFKLPNSAMSTREAYGHALAELAKTNKDIVALDAETSNSTYAEFVKKETPDQFVECYIAEQNMASMALGLSKVGYVPFASSFAAFLSRAFDQIRMSQYSRPRLNIVGSHAGCSIGVDGASQMALEDIAMMRSIRESVVLYPSDAISTYKLTEQMVAKTGIHYLRTTREKTPLLYGVDEQFPVGGCKVHYCADQQFDTVIITAGITLHEALKAQKQLEEKQIHTAVVDLYSIKPLDGGKINELLTKAKHLIVVEDHHEAGGIGEAVLTSVGLKKSMKFTHLCVRKEPRSGSPEELMRYEEIDAQAIVNAITK
ncbi:MAG: transketolase [Microgenomates group bacterium]